MKIFEDIILPTLLCLGHKSELIKEYFYKQRILNSDFSIDLNLEILISINQITLIGM